MDPAPAHPPAYPEHLRPTRPGVSRSEVRAVVAYEAERESRERPQPKGAAK